MTRYCAGCRKDLPLREFNLADDARPMCLRCETRANRVSSTANRLERTVRLEALHQQRLKLIAALIKVDTQIAGLRGGTFVPITLDLDAEIEAVVGAAGDLVTIEVSSTVEDDEEDDGFPFADEDDEAESTSTFTTVESKNDEDDDDVGFA